MAKKKQIELTIEEKLRNALVPRKQQLKKIKNIMGVSFLFLNQLI